MNSSKEQNKRNSTEYIAIDTGTCEACWKCIMVCSNNVIGRINLFFHKHSKINKPDLCTGCMACVKICEHKAIITLKDKREIR